MLSESSGTDLAWSSRGLQPAEALRRWQSWASQTLAPMHIDIPDESRFAARWKSHLVGPLRLVELEATSQRVVHESGTGASHCESNFQLVYCLRTPMHTRVGEKAFCVNAGEIVLLHNAKPYEVRMDGAHRAIDLVIPESWLELWLREPFRYIERPFSASSRWGLPFANFLCAVASEIERVSLPRAVIADQVGSLLAFAVGCHAPRRSRHKHKLIHRVLNVIEERHSDPELDPAEVASALGISKRYLHSLLAEAGTTFLGALGRIRLERARALLSDSRFARCQIAEIAWQCGYHDPSYFARVFRRRFGLGPRAFRAARRV